MWMLKDSFDEIWYLGSLGAGNKSLPANGDPDFRHHMAN